MSNLKVDGGERFDRWPLCWGAGFRVELRAVARALPVAEAMLSLTLADALIEKLGGDSVQEMLPRLAGLRRNHLDDLIMNDAPWRFGYE